jgi:hypothetical protein
MITTFLKVKNLTLSTLRIGVDDVATAFPVMDIAKYPDEYPFHVSVEREIVKVAGKVGGFLDPCIRAQEGTVAVGHVAGRAVELLVTAQQMSDIHTAINTLENGVRPAVFYIPLGADIDGAPVTP